MGGEEVGSSVVVGEKKNTEQWRHLEGMKGKRRAEQQAQAQGQQAQGKHKSMPKKRFYRARAHSNPLSDSQFPVPVKPDEFNWSEHFPAFFPATEPEDSGGGDGSKAAADGNAHESRSEEDAENSVATHTVHCDAKDLKVRFADIGCGFGGLIVKLALLFPEKLMVGMELRDKVTEYVKERILALREQYKGQYENITVLRTNAMKYLPNYFEKGQLEKMFFLFPDPHFKEKNHRRRIISTALLAEYAYVMAIGGILYTITDVQELGEWMKSTLDSHPLFEPLTADELEKDVCVELLSTATEEGQKVERNQGTTYRAIYRRIVAPKDPAGA
ncbi:hypothetical protein BDL97_19G060900 [Sphagnum fallax]|nr:hypothetical protein BDL97_19G060900 [Sphagnum fallax]